MFQYSDTMDLLRGQQALIELGIHCQIYAETVVLNLKSDYYQILSLVLEREELQLPYL